MLQRKKLLPLQMSGATFHLLNHKLNTGNLCLVFKSWLEYRTFLNQTCYEHLNTGPVQYSGDLNSEHLNSDLILLHSSDSCSLSGLDHSISNHGN